MEIKTRYFTENEEDLFLAAKFLEEGKTVVFPTETVYGLGANALSETAVKKIFQAKGRPSDNPLIVHVGKRSDLDRLVEEIPPKAEELMDLFWPGPLTLIFKKSDMIPKAVTGGLDTVAIRMPSHPTARKLLSICSVPVAAPSANRSGFPSPTICEHVKEDMDGRVDGIVCGDDCEVGVESTVLDMSGDIPVLYRPGLITLEQLEEVLGEVRLYTKVEAKEKPKSPGLKYRHYAPKARVEILRGTLEQVKKYAKNCCDKEKTGILVFDEFPLMDDRLQVFSLGKKEEPKDAAHNLFFGLRALDEADVSLILAPEIPDSGIWRAVQNRLYRAAGDKILDLSMRQEILFVCTGNTCRSPMAEGVLAELGKETYDVSSAGLFATGNPVSREAALVMAEQGIDISEHRSVQITADAVKKADLILAMTENHKQMLQSAFPEEKAKIETLGMWAGTDEDVRDPYGGTIEEYRSCRNQILELVKRGILNNHDRD